MVIFVWFIKKRNIQTINNLRVFTDKFVGTAPYPILFIGHGNPMNAIQHNRFSNLWRELGEKLPAPNAILVISAHWETQGIKIMSLTQPPTIHDFGGFTSELSNVSYSAPGHPRLAYDIQQLLLAHERTTRPY